MNRSYSQVVSLASGVLGRTMERSCKWAQSIWSPRQCRRLASRSAVTETHTHRLPMPVRLAPMLPSEIRGDAMVLLSVEKYYVRGAEGYEAARRATVWTGFCRTAFPT